MNTMAIRVVTTHKPLAERLSEVYAKLRDRQFY